MNIANHEQLADAEPEYEEAEYVEPVLADNDIPF